MRPPRWGNKETVFKLVEQRVENFRNEVVNADDYTDPIIRAMAKLMIAEAERDDPRRNQSEQAASAEALRGNVEPLIDLMRPLDGSYIHAVLRPETWDLIAEFMRGERNPKTGKKKGERGPRRKSPEERRKHTPTHDAAELVPVIEEILRNMFPEQRPRDIRDRAVEIAARIKGVETETLETYRRRPQTDRRRL